MSENKCFTCDFLDLEECIDPTGCIEQGRKIDVDMYYKEKFELNKWYYKSHPKGIWHEFTAEMYKDKCITLSI